MKFVPTAYLKISTECILQICLVVEDGETVVYSAFYDNEGKKQSTLTKSRIKESRRGHPYFCKRKQRYYLNDFIKKTTP